MKKLTKRQRHNKRNKRKKKHLKDRDKKEPSIAQKTKPMEPNLTGGEAEDFIEYFSKKLFLQPWVFKNPKYADGDEFTDIAVVFRDKLFLFEIKGNKFNPTEPQRYIKETKRRHHQLKRAARIVKDKSKNVVLKNNFFKYETDFSEIKTVHLISVSTGHGELEIASGASHIDYEKLNREEVTKYLGFYDHESGIHSFTGEEIVFASEHIDTIKDFSWYLDFEKKYLTNQFDTAKSQSIIATVDTHREDLISIYSVNYYWDKKLNTTGKIDLNVILGEADISATDMVMYTATNTRNHLADDDRYKEIMKERGPSYFWDDLINNAMTQFEFAYKITGGNPKKEPVDTSDIRDVLEAMSNTSRFERVDLSNKINTTTGSYCFRNMFPDTLDSDTMFSFMNIEYKNHPNKDAQNEESHRHMYSAWCRVEHGTKLANIRNKIKKVLLITKHNHENSHAYSFGLTTRINVEKDACRKLGLTD